MKKNKDKEIFIFKQKTEKCEEEKPQVKLPQLKLNHVVSLFISIHIHPPTLTIQHISLYNYCRIEN